MSRLLQILVNAALVIGPGGLITYGVTERKWVTAGAGLITLLVGVVLIHVMDQKMSTGLALARLYSKLGVYVPKEADLQSSVFTPGWVLRFVLGETARFPDSSRPRSRMLIYQGIPGRCYRMQSIIKVPTNSADYKERLVGEFGFTPAYVRHVPTDRTTTLCVPILDGRKRVRGVLSLDAKQDVFSDEVIKRIEEELSLFFEALEIY